jgi:hypothetical protein
MQMIIGCPTFSTFIQDLRNSPKIRELRDLWTPTRVGMDTHWIRPDGFVDTHLILPDADDNWVSNLFNL